MSAIDHLIHANATYIAQFPGARPLRPKLGLAVVACMDSRLDLFGALGLEIGDAHLIRNAGGMVTDDVLRSLAHIVDMHQLTKDPYQLLDAGPETASSPKRTLKGFELSRYLIYCTELLAHIGKVAALHVQNFDDPVTLEGNRDDSVAPGARGTGDPVSLTAARAGRLLEL